MIHHPIGIGVTNRSNSINIIIDIISAKAIATSIISTIKLEQSGILIGLELSQLSNQLQDIQSALEIEGSDTMQIKKASERVRSAYLEAFHLTEALITYDSEESEALDNYFYSVDLLLKCKQEAARLSPATWDVIESELLLPPDD
jgi:hypothetical protein